MRISLWVGWVILGGCSEDARLGQSPAGFLQAGVPPALTACTSGTAAVIDGVAYTRLATAASNLAPDRTLWICPGEYEDVLTFTGAGPYVVAGVTGDRSDVVLFPPPGATTGVTFNAAAGGLSLRIQDLTLERYGEVAGNEAFLYAGRRSVVELENLQVQAVGRVNSNFSTMVSMNDGLRLFASDVHASDLIRTKLFELSANDPDLPPFDVELFNVSYTKGVDSPEVVAVWGSERSGRHRGLDFFAHNLEISDSQFTGTNSMTFNPGPQNVRIEHSDFSRNKIVDTGIAAVLSFNPSDSFRGQDPIARIEIVASTFHDNQCDGYVCAIRATDTEGLDMRLDVTDSSFLRNRAALVPQSWFDGAAVALDGGAARFRNVDFGTGPDDNLPNDLDNRVCPDMQYGLVRQLTILNPNNANFPTFCRLTP